MFLWSAVFVASLAAGSGPGDPRSTVSIAVDSSKHELIVTAGRTIPKCGD